MEAKKRIIFRLLTLVWLCTTLSCNIYKQIPEGSSALVSNEIVILGQEKDLINDFFYKDELFKIPIQKPNKRFLGIPLSQHIWAYYNQKKITKFSQFMKTKVGKSPVLFDSTKLERSRIGLENYYYNLGHLDNTVKVSFATHKKRTKVKYEIEPKTPYRLRNIAIDTQTEVQKEIYNENTNTLLNRGDVLNIERLEREINRMTYIANDKGFYNFTKNNVRFKFDTFHKTHELDLYIKILEETDTTYFQKYKLDSIYVFINSPNEQATVSNSKMTRIGGNVFIQTKDLAYNEFFLNNFIYKNQEGFYSKGDINRTIQKLSELNNFKLINPTIIYATDSSKRLHLIYSLTPGPKRTVSFEQSFYNSTLGFIGAQPKLNYVNKNLTHKADKLSISVSGAIELNAYLNQNRNASGLISRTDISMLASYGIEKFLLPKFLVPKNKLIYSKTFINTNYTFSKRLGFYDIHNIGINMEYAWAGKKNTTLSYTPMSVNAIIFPENSVSEEFQNTLNNNPFLRSTFNNSFIIGSNFSLNHLAPIGRRKKNSFNIRWNLEMAGNSVYVLDKILPLSKDRNEITIGDINVSQFIKSQVEVINSTRLTQVSSLHSRAKLGLAFPFGNSENLPYIKQYFIGGPFSIRAFQPRTIGAGSHNPGIFGLDSLSFPRDQIGNMVIEFNSEYRFHIISFLKGALFLDGGNIWNSSSTFSQDELGVFKLSDFYKQMYLGGGFGLRGDFNYFVMRFDIGIPLRVPYLEKNEWVILDAKPLNGDWFRNNVVINFAVGYPF